MQEILRMENITKVYPNGFVANKNVTFSVQQGEVHALMGENGAGKSTLMKILFGIEKQQKGIVYLKNKVVNISSSSDAIQNSIFMVHQHFMLVPSLSVAENVVLGMEPSKYGFFDLEKAREITKKIIDDYNFKIDPKAKIKDLPIGQRQKVEIIKALARHVEILILDEPTAVLTAQEVDGLFDAIRNLKRKNHTIIFISHKLNEIKQIADRMTILRNGEVQKMVLVDSVDEREISRLMVGRDVELKVEKKSTFLGAPCLRVRNLSSSSNGKKGLNDVSLSVNTGEIVGIIGVQGNGQSKLVDCITGMKNTYSGVIEIDKSVIKKLSVREVRELGVSHIPEDRIKFGTAIATSIRDNLMSERFYKKEYNRFFLLNLKKINKMAKKLVNSYHVKCQSIKQNLERLSGGNMQKVVLVRELSSSPKLLIANQPSRGVDVGAIEFIYKKLVALRDAHTAVLLISADLNEALELSDRILIMYEGEIVAGFKNPKKVDVKDIGAYMLGIKKQTNEILGEALHV